MNFEGPQQPDPMARIQAIIQQLQAMGANDQEMPLIEQIIKDMQSDKITPEEAVNKAQGILDNKQDYH